MGDWLVVDQLRLPRSAGAARLLAHCLVSQQRPLSERLIRTLTYDPPLVVWVLLQLEREGGVPGGALNLEGVLAALTPERVLKWLDGVSDEPTEDFPLEGREAQTRLADETAALIYRSLPRDRHATDAHVLGLLVATVRDRLETWLQDATGTCPAALELLLDQCRRRDSFRAVEPLSDGVWSDDNVAELLDHWKPDPESQTLLFGCLNQQRRLLELETQFEETLQSEKLAAMKQLAYGASHEINNPLANISSRAQTLLRDETDPARQKTLAAINRQAFRAHEMIADLMLFAHPPRLEPTDFSVGELLRDVERHLAPFAADQDTELIVQSVDAHITGDRVQLNVAVQALVRNSLESLGQGGNVRLHGGSDGHSTRVTVSDTGPGIPDDVRHHLFDPFFSGREAGRGLGFGLSKAWRIAQQHGGDVLVHSSTESGTEGTEVTLLLPSHDELES